MEELADEGVGARRSAMSVHVGKWGNSLGVRIPQAVAKELGLRDGTEVELVRVEGGVVLRPTRRKRPAYSLKQLLAGVTAENSPGAVDWGEAMGREAC